jgi:hypothetical protein
MPNNYNIFDVDQTTISLPYITQRVFADKLNVIHTEGDKSDCFIKNLRTSHS